MNGSVADDPGSHHRAASRSNLPADPRNRSRLVIRPQPQRRRPQRRVLVALEAATWGTLSDRIGRGPVMLIGVLGMAVATLPGLLCIDGSWQRLALVRFVTEFFLAVPRAISPAFMAELVPTRIRRCRKPGVRTWATRAPPQSCTPDPSSGDGPARVTWGNGP